MGMTQILMDTKIDADQRDCLETIRYSSDVLLGLINGILDLSKIEARKLELEDISYDLNSLIENAVEMLAAKAEEKSIRLYSLIDANVPLILKGDPQRVRQVLVNLVSNAVKFTEFGEVAVHARVLATKDGRASMIRCEVRDSGAGISPDVQARLFKPFEQADGSTTRRFGGTGLGLSISKRLIELMGGVIGLLSKPGAGSTFWFEIPFREGHLAAVDNRGSVAGKRVLIVDDEPLERTILRRQLERHGLLLDEAAGPRQALAQLRSRQLEGLPFDFALVDYKMPDMDGIDLGRQVRNDPGLNATRLILITSLRDRKVGRDAITAGFHAYLSKPLKVSQLVETMQGSLRPPADLGVPENTNDEKIGGRILVAEDSAVNQKVMMKVLTKLGYKPEMVNNGRSAMEAALSNKYSAILMDCQMPEMDGYEATAEIRRRETEGQRVPIIALTANAMKGDSDRCFEAGMDDYISKPVDLAVLAQVLQRWTDVSKNTRQPELQPSSDAG
jgi:CheY-like chemotaxis protein